MENNENKREPMAIELMLDGKWTRAHDDQYKLSSAIEEFEAYYRSSTAIPFNSAETLIDYANWQEAHDDLPPRLQRKTLEEYWKVIEKVREEYYADQIKS